jgi:hypothetical protein
MNAIKLKTNDQTLQIASMSKIYIIDFLNVFSDFREMKYKLQNIDFHKTKDANIVNDTRDFFQFFFTKFVPFKSLDTSGNYIFVMKKLKKFEEVFMQMLQVYQDYQIDICIIEDRYQNEKQDKNKDDYLCQYMFSAFTDSKDNMPCTLVSNDQYRDNHTYVNLFKNTIDISLCRWDAKKNTPSVAVRKMQLHKHINERIATVEYNRCSIPKRQLHKLF